VNTSGPVSLLVKQSGSAVADALEQGLRAAGLRVVVAPSPFDTVIEAARAAGIQHLVVGVDYFGPEEFRLLPLFRREWPDTVIVAYHAPGFEHKGRIAELVGADVVLSRPGDVARFLEALRSGEAAASLDRQPRAASAEPARAAPPATGRHVGQEPPAPPPARPTEAKDAPAPAPEPAAAGMRTHPDSTPEPPADEDRVPAAPPVPQDVETLDGNEALSRKRALGTIKLTDEELRILLGEDDDT